MSTSAHSNGLRTGRTSSQISVYDYPEHLNPFYEDEQHKRLRFWKIGSKKEKSLAGCRPARSNSFSLDGIKDIWTLKSFRLRKKSSSLGINRTSESPPTLRRMAPPIPNQQYGTYDSRLRNTVNVGLNNNFDRNAGYRSSLQDMSKVKEDNNVGFYRNNRYRSTLQSTPIHSNAGTPTMQHRNGNAHGGSQSSLNSTNPFDENEDTISVNTLRKPARKKRRAPPPPVNVPQITTTESDGDPEKQLEIHNLTAEIESFVKLSNDDSATAVTVTSTSTTKNEEDKRQEILEKTVDVKVVLVDDNKLEEIAENKTVEHEIKENEITTQIDSGKEEFVDEKEKVVESVTIEVMQKNNDAAQTDCTELTKNDIIEERNVEKISKIDEIEMVEEPKHESVIVEKKIIQKQEVRIVNLPSDHEDDDIEHFELPNTPHKSQLKSTQESSSVTVTTEKKPVELKRHTAPSLRISESLESLTEKDLENSQTNPTKIKTENYEFEVRFVPLRTSGRESRYETWSNENSLQRQNSNDSTRSTENGGHRKSVKEIIESINKSQSLLKVNHGDADGPETNNNLKVPSDEILAITESTDSLTRNLNSLLEDEKKINNFLAERASTSSANFDKNNDELNNNLDDVFQKCELRKKDGLDWNPLPKPRRSRNFSDEHKNKV